MTRITGRILLAAALALLSTGTAAPGRAEQPLASQGAALYGRYCSACHGSDGRGTGIVSGLLNPKPADLTKLAKKAGGKFPFYEVMRIIDGRETVRAHGDPVMPVWGEMFARESGPPNERARLVARGKVVEITEHLARIQEP
jgi:mono/diheme cytochrome c family protein